MIARKPCLFLCQSGNSHPAQRPPHNTADNGDDGALCLRLPACQRFLHMVHFDSPARAHLPPSPHGQPVHLPRLPPVHAYFNGNLWDYLQAASPTSTGSAGPAPYAMNSGAAPDHARPLPVHPPGVVPNRPWQRLPPSTSPAPHSPHEFPLAHHFIDAFPPYRPLLDPSHARAHPPPTSQSPPWYTPHMQYFPPPPPASAPPTPVHKVWILDCKSCGTFLTNRGMKVSV